MGNLNYIRSRRREIDFLHSLQKKGWFSIRAAGSHGIADVIAIKPVKNCANPSHFEVKFIQIKVSQNLVKYHLDVKLQETPFGPVNVEFHHFPVKCKKWFDARRKTKEKKIKKKK